MKKLFVVLVLMFAIPAFAQFSGQTVKWGEQPMFGTILNSDSVKVFNESYELNGPDTVYTGAINYDAIDGITKFAVLPVDNDVSGTPDSINVDFRLGHKFEDEDGNEYYKFEGWKNIVSNSASGVLNTWRFNVADTATYSPSDFLQFRAYDTDADSSLVLLKEYVK